MINILKNQKGFTLIELIAVLIVIVAIGSITLSLIISSLRATDKTNVINVVRQNGNFALQEMSRRIQYAKSFNGVSGDGVNYTKDCLASNTNSTPAPTLYTYAAFTLDDNSIVVFRCDLNSDPATMTLSNKGTTGNLINTTDVKLTSCSFTCYQKNYTDPPSIGISFTLSQAGTANFAEKSASIDFATTVTMRNANK